VFGVEEQSKALGAVLAKAGISGLASNFLMFVASNRRLFAVGDMIRDFLPVFACLWRISWCIPHQHL